MKRIILLFMFLGLLVSVSAQTTTNPIWKTYLEGHNIHHMVDAGNYLWLTSYFEPGVIKFDKNTEDVVFYSFESVIKSPECVIQSIACDKNGLPWIGVYDIGILKMNEDEKWIFLPSINEYEPVVFSDILISENDTVWAVIGVRVSTGGIHKILARYQGYTVDNFAIDNITSSLAKDNDENLWFGTCYGDIWLGTSYATLVKFDGENYTSYNAPAQWEPKPNFFREIIIDESGNTWVVGSFGILSSANRWIKFNGSDWQVYDFPVTDLRVDSLALQEDGSIWLAGNKGLMKFCDSQWTVYNTQNSELPNNTIFSMVIDDSGTKWMGTENGLVAFNENGLLSTTEHSKLMNDIVLFPNPAKDFITLKLPDGIQISKVDIFDIQGKTIKTFSVNNQQNLLDVSSFPSGIYLVRNQSEENYIVKKFVKL